jgi:DNA-binding NtrC family response regulator
MRGAMNETPTVLLVEDDHIVLDATTQTLTEGGCVVRPATSYAEALGTLEECPDTSVLVTDIMLDGESSGLDLVREAHARRPDLGIIILSGEVRPSAETLPAKALFCTKPCAPGALLTLVRQCTDW